MLPRSARKRNIKLIRFALFFAHRRAKLHNTKGKVDNFAPFDLLASCARGIIDAQKTNCLTFLIAGSTFLATELAFSCLLEIDLTSVLRFKVMLDPNRDQGVLAYHGRAHHQIVARD